MKVNISIETTDMEGNVSHTKQVAVMEKNETGYRLVYVESIVENGEKIKSTMMLNGRSLRVVRTGGITCDFMYGDAMVHNTLYGTPYGNIPVVLATKQYDFVEEWLTEDAFSICVDTRYDLIFDGQSPMPMRIRLEIRPAVG